MRALLSFAVLLAAAAPAAARPDYERLGLDAEVIPVQCDAVISGTRMGARLTAASCIAKLNLAKVELAPTLDVVEKMNRAVAFPDELLDSVMASGTPAEQVQAARLESEQYNGMVARVRHACEQLSWHTTGDELERAQAQHHAIEHAIAPWQRKIAGADALIVTVARQHPELRKDPVARIAIERVIPPQTASR